MTETIDVQQQLSYFHNEEWEAFQPFEEFAEEELDRITRSIDPMFIQYVQEKIFDVILTNKDGRTPTLRLVVDSNIIVQDSIRVAKGKYSSTERILSSPYLEVIAPDNLEEETFRILNKRLKDQTQLNIAVTHAQKLITKIKKLSIISSTALNKAYSLISSHSPEDVPFLALAIDTESPAIISRDKRAFDEQVEVKRWELGETAKLIITYESGALSLFVLGSVFEGLIKIFETLLLIFISAFVKAIEIISSFIIWLVEGTADALSNIPPWAWAIIAGVCIATIIGLIISENFRKAVTDGISKIGEIIKTIIEGIIQTIKDIWNAIKDLMLWIWGMIEPVVPSIITVVGVMFRRICVYLSQTEIDPDEEWDTKKLFKRLKRIEYGYY